MIRFVLSAFAFGISCTVASANAFHFNPTQPTTARNMLTYGATTMPVGYYDYCRRYRGECARGPEGTMIKLTKPSWREIVSVNAEVNTAIAPLTDMEIFGVEERWEYPTTVGDCEDYALLKRKRLNEMGYPLGALLLTVARDAKGGGHAVLTVVTDLGDFVLDNLEQKVLLWKDTEIYYLKRQSGEDLNRWVSLINEEELLMSSGRSQAPSTAAASVRR
ncbi:transglutaminase [Salmonella enterica subsp. enterica]|jgi:predicted transglutaminase-like cysteine proteinase|uniref:transglutaminase-like cysteine peptidase n=1 Tax=Nitratireductor rhodophyticola TaxID=2854036 RepID=UPI000FAA9E64|nr:transglutaminase [Salmonella enterica subsp. enterica]MIL10052.1 transglutaminase [Salmonella enterica subsp. enterica serovar Enteritidis]